VDAGEGRRTGGPRKSAKLHEASVQARRRLRHLRRRNRDETGIELARGKYREARCSLRAAIGKSKAAAWGDLIFSLNEDPWGRPYMLVLNKLRPRAPPTTEFPDPGFLGEVVGALFHGGAGDAVPSPPLGEVPE